MGVPDCAAPNYCRARWKQLGPRCRAHAAIWPPPQCNPNMPGPGELSKAYNELLLSVSDCVQSKCVCQLFARLSLFRCLGLTPCTLPRRSNSVSLRRAYSAQTTLQLAIADLQGRLVSCGASPCVGVTCRVFRERAPSRGVWPRCCPPPPTRRLPLPSLFSAGGCPPAAGS